MSELQFFMLVFRQAIEEKLAVMVKTLKEFIEFMKL